MRKSNNFKPNRLHNTLLVGQVFLHADALDSTNAAALELIAKSKPSEGTVVATWQQRAGRGQIGSLWHSAPDKNVSLSAIFYPRFLPAAQQFQLTQAAALAVADTVQHYLPQADVRIKWPNDVLAGGKKVSGILIQCGLAGQQLQYAVVGIGLNVNQDDFGPDLPQAGSLSLLAAGRQFDLREMEARLCQDLEARYFQLRARQMAAIEADYFDRLHLFMSEALFSDAQGAAFWGRITGLSPSGQLEVQTAQGTRYFGLKEIRFPEAT